MSYDIQKLIEFAKAHPEEVAWCARKARLELNAIHALGYRLDPEFGINVQAEEPDFEAAAAILQEWEEVFPEGEPSWGQLRERLENLLVGTPNPPPD